MILKNKPLLFIATVLLLAVLLFNGCFRYSFRDASIPKEIKTVRVNYVENRARYINPQLSPQLTDKLRQKINNQTRLTQVSGEDADYDISATITDYSFSTTGISGNQEASNRLTVTVQVKLLNRKDNKTKDESVSRNFEFAASKSITQAEAELNESILRNMTDEIFNRIFSNW
jgi:outer membrane lipopolysaccharide assembly protein LptE/RlpB